MDGRLIIDPPQRGSWNMAVDEALLRSAANDGICTLRFYRWSEPTLSLGYFQKVCDRDSHPPSLNCPFVRRVTGGGAILHHHELTYSLSLPVGRETIEHRQLYFDFHSAIQAGVALQGIRLEIAQTVEENHAFLCFERRSPGDLLLFGSKIAGSAQRRWKGGLLQHGSILISRSPFAPSLPGIVELGFDGFTGKFSSDQLIESMRAWFAKRNLNFSEKRLTLLEMEAAREIESAQFDSQIWNSRR